MTKKKPDTHVLFEGPLTEPPLVVDEEKARRIEEKARRISEMEARASANMDAKTKAKTEAEIVKERIAREKLRVGKRVAIISVKLPLAYLKILETEAELLRIPRSQFLSLLVAHKCNGLTLQRPSTAPEYSFSDKELAETKLFLWYCHTATRVAVDRDRKQMGLSSFASWVNVALNHWIGRPGGLRSGAWP